MREVSVDMWGGFPKVIKEVFPNALMVIARFHVMKLVNKALNKMRLNLELKGLKNRYLLLKNEADLTETEKLELADLLKDSACLGIAYELKEELRNIYETSSTVKIGLKRLKSWLNSARIIFKKAVNSIENHLVKLVITLLVKRLAV